MIKLIFSVLFVILVIIIYLCYKTELNSPIDRILDKIPILATILIAIGIYISYNIFKIQTETIERDGTFKIIDRMWININDNMTKYYKDSPIFISSLYYDWQLDQEKNINVNIKNDNFQVNNYISILIFQGWEDFVISRNIDKTDAQSWINIFLQWCNSPYLFNSWNKLKSGYDNSTVELGNLLFEISKKNKPKNEKELREISDKILNNQKYLKIFN